jgi:hypothetical protein
MISKNPFGVILILPLIVLASLSILAQNRRSAIDYVARGTARMDATIWVARWLTSPARLNSIEITQHPTSVVALCGVAFLILMERSEVLRMTLGQLF